MANAKGVNIGLSDVYIALLVDDPASGTASYGEPVRVAGAISANVNPNASTETLFADNGPYETATTIGKVELALNVADLDLDTQGLVLGHAVAGGVLVRKSTDIPPWLAVGYKTLKSNGGFRFTWLAKGKFSLPEQANETRGDSINFQTPTINGSFVKRDCDDEWQRSIDTDHVNYIPSMGDNWFNTPYGTMADTTNPTVVSVTPADNAAAVAVGSTIVWIFSKAMALSTLTKFNFAVVKDSDGSSVAGSLVVNAGRTQVTFTPSAPLTAASIYRTLVTTAVQDISGNNLIAAKLTKFTTA